MSRYLFDNAARQTQARLIALESCYDAFSRRQLELAGLTENWRCLEVGAGGGSLGDWLGEQVGADGEVTVTDIEPRWAEAAPRPRPANVRLLRHDIVHDPLPGQYYDLVHARLVLLHLPQRLRVLQRLVTALRPGGRLVLEEFDCSWIPLLAVPDEGAADLFEHVLAALWAQLEKAGADPRWGRRVYGAMRAAGLEDVTATTYAESWPGGSTGACLHRANIEQVAGLLTADGITADELARFYALIQDPAFAVNSYPLISVRGRRPETEAAR
ncbi:methyltransferase [Streptomyces viridochromogenes]|uniref:methyltransferase n=1 Tax=Streptomyces viridochromogenes TaxID=1938 RepID=UPI00069CCAD2|nr:methyltransferase domain-containing protein [Streptomyces viridochromogenes]KOG13337.1 methyltransferase [Streptomyces viridochromogenes]KOG13441.1 methyltransferase [Streptomyces viridochromogenes]